MGSGIFQRAWDEFKGESGGIDFGISPGVRRVVQMVIEECSNEALNYGQMHGMTYEHDHDGRIREEVAADISTAILAKLK